MAITLISTPANDSDENVVNVRPLHQRWIYIAESDNYTEDGFRYVVNLTSENGSPALDYTAHIPAAPDGRLIFDATRILAEAFALNHNVETIHFATDETAATESSFGRITISVKEAYIVAGVYTIDDPSEVTEQGPWCFYGAYDGATGPYPPESAFACTNEFSRLLSDRKPSTKFWEGAVAENLDTECVFIPVRNRDYGVLNMFQALVSDPTAIQYRIHKADGTTETQDLTPVGETLCLYPCYPANINAGACGVDNALRPSNNAGWRCYTLQLFNGDDAISRKYVFYRVAEECDYQNIRLGWLGHRGSWEYFNFQMRNFFTREVQRARFERGFSGASFNGQTRKMYERYPTVDRFLDISSTYLTHSEKEYLQWLIQSKEVRIIRDNGTSIPVVVETNSWTPIQRAEPNPLEQAFIRLRYAGDDLNFNGWFVDENEEVPPNPFDTGGFRLVYQPGATNMVASIVLFSDGGINVDIDWGDGNIDTAVDGSNMNHTYTAPGVYTVRITNPTAPIRGITSTETILIEVYEIPSSVDGTLRFGDSFLSAENCDYLYIKLDQNGGDNGTLILPRDATSTSAIGAKNNLISKGWNITIDP